METTGSCKKSDIYARVTNEIARAIEAGEPNQNAYIERFNRTFCQEVLNAYLFEDLD